MQNLIQINFGQWETGAFICITLLSCLIIDYSIRRIDSEIKKPRSLYWVTVGLLTASMLLSQQTVENTKKEIEYLMTDVVSIIADEFEQLEHDKITVQTPADDPLYLRLIETQKRILKSTPSVSEIYTMRRLPDGKIALIVDSETDYNLSGFYDEPREQRTPIGQTYQRDNEKLNKALMGEKVFDYIPYHDQWGEWVSAYIPLRRPDGKIDSILGVVYSAKQWEKAISNARLIVFLKWYSLIILIWGITLGANNYKIKVIKEAELKAHSKAEMLKATRLSALVTMSAGVAHDLKNALTPISIGLEELRDGQPAKPAVLDALGSSLQRGKLIVKQLEGFAKGVKGEHVILQPYYVLKQVQPVLTATYPKNIVILPRFETDLAPISGDPGQLQEVLLVLCANARDAMPDGGKLSLEAQNRQYIQGALAPGSLAGVYVVLRVQDEGLGITDENKNRIFDPYFTTKSRQQASGMGLPSAAAIIAAHRGFIKFQSEVGKGSVFEVFLPTMSSEALEDVQPSPTSAGRIASGSVVLLISQDLEVREMVSANLKLLGYAVASVNDATDTLVVITEQHENIGLILIDQNLPDQDSYSLIKVIQKILSAAPIVAISNREQDTLKPDFQAYAINHLWLKPFNNEELDLLLPTPGF